MCITNRGTKRIASAPLPHGPLDGLDGGIVASGGFWAPDGLGGGAFGGNGLLTVRDFSAAAAVTKSKETPDLPSEVTIVRSVVKPTLEKPLPASSASANPSACQTTTPRPTLGSTTPPARTRPKRKRRPQKPGKTAKHNDRHFVVHNYHDHSQDKEEDFLHEEHFSEEHDDHDEHLAHDGGDAEEEHKPATKRRRGGVSVPFPLKLHDLLDQIERDGLAGVISWLPHGRAFAVHKPRNFVEVVMPRYFRQTKLTSFQRQLNLYGFQRLTRGPDGGGYYHELFLRDMPFLTKQMVRTKVKGTKFKAASSPDTEPDFYKMPAVNVRPSLYKGESKAEAALVSPPHSDEDADCQGVDCESRDSSREASPAPHVANVSTVPPVTSHPGATLNSDMERVPKMNVAVSPLASPAQLPKPILTFQPVTIPPVFIAIPAGSFAPDMTMSTEAPQVVASHPMTREGSETANVAYAFPTGSTWWVNPDQAPATDPDKSASPAGHGAAFPETLIPTYQTSPAPKPSMDEDPIADFLKDWVESDVEDDMEPDSTEDDALSVSSDAFNVVSPVCDATSFEDDDAFGRFLEEVVGV